MHLVLLYCCCSSVSFKAILATLNEVIGVRWNGVQKAHAFATPRGTSKHRRVGLLHGIFYGNSKAVSPIQSLGCCCCLTIVPDFLRTTQAVLGSVQFIKFMYCVQQKGHRRVRRPSDRLSVRRSLLILPFDISSRQHHWHFMNVFTRDEVFVATRHFKESNCSTCAQNHAWYILTFWCHLSNCRILFSM